MVSAMTMMPWSVRCMRSQLSCVHCVPTSGLPVGVYGVEEEAGVCVLEGVECGSAEDMLLCDAVREGEGSVR